MADLQHALMEQRRVPVVFADEAGPPEFDGQWVRVRYYREGKLVGITCWTQRAFYWALGRAIEETMPVEGRASAH